MRKLVLGLGLWAMSSAVAFGCDVCGASAGGNLMGIVPQFGNHFVGFRYQYSGLHTVHPPSILDEGRRAVSTDQFHSMEAYGRYYPHPRVQLLAFVPYVARYRTTDGKTVEGKGLGDITLLANYILVNTGDSLDRKVKHTVMLGGGLKMPTGRSGLTDNGTSLVTTLQPGSGSWDALFNAQYTVRLKKWGASMVGMYRLNTANADGFKNGDRISGNLFFYHWIAKGKWNVMPSVGLALDHALRDNDNGHLPRFSGGTELRGTVDLQVYLGQVGIGLGCRVPMAYNLSDGTATPAPQYMFSLNFLL